MKPSKLISTSLLAVVMAGCSSTDDVSERIAALESAQQARIAEQKELAQERAEEQLNAAPDWYLAPPAADATGFFGVGYARSKNLGHGVKSARLQAEFDLAKMYKQELSGSERAFERGDSEGNVTTQTTFLIDKIIDAVPIIGYTVIDQQVSPIGGIYEAFVLLKLPYSEFNKVLQDQRKGEIDTTVQAAFDDLERRLKDRRAEKEAALDADHERNIEMMQQRQKMLSQTTSKAPAVSETETQKHSQTTRD